MSPVVGLVLSPPGPKDTSKAMVTQMTVVNSVD